ncbi:hypothetical protein CVT25_013620 [Psilocybe cyanescens]|uniref:Uncharacterized protein n=1 Tax=Psilocybe cyanescens TaxID=93625 RepID=A0A409WT83_PSICY|nr:hypothetical protein CVT25_013620 [Psilocybe cyanescens]
MELLTSQLEIVLKTLETMIQSKPDIAQIDLSQTRQVLRRLDDCLKPRVAPERNQVPHAKLNPATLDDCLKPRVAPERNQVPHAKLNPATSTKSYAEATAPTTKGSKPQQRPTPQKTNTDKQIPHGRGNFSRLIVDFGEGEVKRRLPSSIRNRLNALKAPYSDSLRFQFSGAEFSRHGKLILTVTPPSAVASVLREHQSSIISCLRNALEIPDDNPILMYPDRPWHRVVIHKIPLNPKGRKDGGYAGNGWDDYLETIHREWTEYNPVAKFVPTFARERLLVPKSAPIEVLKARESISLCVAFEDVKHARRLIQEGAFFLGTHCRASPYRPRAPRPRD